MVRAISDSNNGSSTFPRRLFTASDANKMLPLVRGIAADLVRLNRSIEAQREQLRGIDELPQTMNEPDYREEVTDIRRSLADDEHRLRECLDELTALGLEAHRPLDGSIDFPAVINRRQIRLCWHPSDERVEHWHDLGQLPSKRKRLENIGGDTHAPPAGI